MKKILIVDDSMFMRGILKHILSGKYEVVEAHSRATALDQLKHEKPDLVLLDIIMPGDDEEGVKILQEIMKTNPGARVVMITAVGHEAMINACKTLGARDYIVKPFDEKLVAKTVEKYLTSN